MQNIIEYTCATIALVAVVLVVLAGISYWWFQNAAAMVFIQYLGPIAFVGIIAIVVSRSFRKKVSTVLLEFINPFNWSPW